MSHDPADQEVVTEICYDWMIEFACHEVWHKFMSGSDKDRVTEDLANALMFAQKDRSGENIRGKEVAFLNLTCYMMNLKKNGPDNVDLLDVEFKHILRLIDSLSYLCRSGCTDSMKQKASNARQKTLLQRFNACCRRGDYDKAEEIFEEEREHFDKESSRKVQAILNAEKKPHRFLEDNTLEEYVHTVTKFLEKVYQTFPAKPTLRMFADRFASSRRYERAKTSHSLKEIEESMDYDGELEKTSARRELTLSSKLARIREEKRQAAAESVATCTNSSAEEDAPLPDSQGTSSPKKQRNKDKHHTKLRHESDGGRGNRSTGHHEEDEEMSDTESDASFDEDQESSLSSLQKRVPFRGTAFHKRPSLAMPVRKAQKRSKPYRQMWTQREEEDFYKAVQRYGVGQWALIRESLRTSRSNVNLKDKWRTICRLNYDELCRKFGPAE